MRFDLDSAMGIHEQALYLRARRGGVLASNLANADTPNYKAQDLDFQSALRSAAGLSDGDAIQMSTTHASHQGGRMNAGGEALYRVPTQPSLDGNTVDAQIEKVKFAENALQYQASLQFLGAKIRNLMLAIKGE